MIAIFYRILSRVVEGLIILSASVILIIVTIEVGLRYIFGLSLIFTEELSRYLMVWVVFLGGAIAIRDGSHITISVFVVRLNTKMRQIVQTVAHALTLAFLVVITIEGIRILPRQLYQMCITIDISLFYFYLAIPTGSILMIIFLLPYIKKTFRQKPAEDNARRGSTC